MSRCSDRRVGRVLSVALLVAVAVSLFATSASAHAVLGRSDPVAGAVLSGDPAVVHLWFTEEISPRYSSARLVNATGEPIAGTRTIAGDSRSLALALPALPTGAYGVLWQVLSQVDGHPSKGALVFSVGAPGQLVSPSVAIGTDTSAPPAEVLLRWLAFCLLAGVLGGLAIVVFVLARAVTKNPHQPLRDGLNAARRRVLGLTATCAVAGAALAPVALVEEGRQVIPPGLDGSWLGSLGHLVTSTRWGHLWLAREVATVLLVFTLLSVSKRVRTGLEPGRKLGLSCILALSVVWIQALGSHAAALGSGRTLAVVADAVHLLTACLWIGSLLAIALIMWPRSDSAATIDRSALVRACRMPFSQLAAGSVCLVVATGLYSAGREVDTMGSVGTTTYGRTLLVKSVLVLAVVMLGGLNAARLHGWRPVWLGPARRIAGSAPSRRLILAELAVGVLILLAVGVLTGNPPAGAPASQLVTAAQTKTVSGSVDDLVVSTSISPNRPGVNEFTVLASSSRRPPPAAIDGVNLLITGSGENQVVRLQEIEPGRYFAAVTLRQSGQWQMTTIVSRAGETLNIPLAWRVSVSPPPPPAVAPGGRPLAPWLNGLALLILAAGSGVAVWRWRRSKRPQDPASDPTPKQGKVRDAVLVGSRQGDGSAA